MINRLSPASQLRKRHPATCYNDVPRRARRPGAGEDPVTNSRHLTKGEWRSLSPGLNAALRAAGARPILKAAAHPAARVAALWRGAPPILARGDTIWWPAAPLDLSAPSRAPAMAILQHELQHVLDYRTGWLTAAGYLSNPRHWTYAWRLEDVARWDDLGAEQRASIAQRLWMIEHGLADARDLPALRRLIPWA